MRPARVIRSAIVLKPSTILDFHRILRNRKYRLLFSPKRRGRTGPTGPSKELVDAIVEMKRRNPVWGCPRIAQQIGLTFNIQIEKDVVRRVLATHYRPGPDASGPSWLTVLGHAKDSLWSIDLFRCESAILRSHWVLVVMDQYRWSRTVRHVQPCHSSACGSEVPQLRPRSAIPVPPVARQPAGAACDRGQECSVRADVPSVCRTVDRHTTTRMLGSGAVLVRAGPGTQAVCIPGLLQRSSGTCVFGRTNASPDTEGCRHAQPLPMGNALPRTLSDADRGVTSEQRRRWLAGRLARVRSSSRDRHRETEEYGFSSTSYAGHPYSCG